MKTGIYSWFGYMIDIKKRFEMIKSVGFDCVMLWWGDEFRETDGDKELLPDMIRTAGLEIENVHLPYEAANDIWKDSIEGTDLMNSYIGAIDDCAIHGISTAVLHITSGSNPPPFSNLGLERFKSIVEHAEKKGIGVALENLRRPDYLDKIFTVIDSPYLGFCYDSGHENCFTKDIDFLHSYGNKLMALHLHDNDGTGDQHRVPGEGMVNWEKVKKQISNSVYTGAITMEVTNEFSEKHADLEAYEFLTYANREIKKIFA